MTGVVVVGSLHTDFVANAARLPRPGETLLGYGFSTHPGGKAGNQAVGVARQGVPCALVARLGRDRFGDALREAVAAVGVDTSALTTDDGLPTGASLALTGERGDYASVIVPAASLRLSAADIAAAQPVFRRASVVVTQFELGIEAAGMVLRAGRRHSLTTVLNAAPVPDSPVSWPAGFWSLVDLLVVNRGEAAALADRAVHSVDDARAVVRGVANRLRIPSVVVTLGDQGVVAWHGGKGHGLPAWSVVPVDALGAGDAFVAVLAAGMAEERSFVESLSRANAAGALAVTRAGAFAGQPTRAEIDAFLAAAAHSR